MNFRLLKKLWYWNSLLLLVLVGCKEDPLPPVINEGSFKNGVFITNEGQFQAGNASVSFYNTEDQTIQEKIFSAVNNQPLGDVLQSLTMEEAKSYLVVNFSDKIEVVNTANFSSIGTIEDLGSPRHLQKINEEKAYVSDLYNNAISIVNLNTYKKTGSIPISSSSEEMQLVGKQLFATCPSLFDNYSNQILVIDTESDEVTDSITVGYNPSNIQVDKNNQLWVVCNGDRAESTHLGGLFRIDPNTKQVTLSLSFTDQNTSFYPRLAMNKERDLLYFLKLDIYKLGINATTLPETPFIPANGRDFYGLGVHPTTNEIYVGDSGNFGQKGTVTIHDDTGIELTSFKAGVGTNGFYFNE